MDPYTLDRDGLAALLERFGERAAPSYRVRQIRRWLARGVDDGAEMTDLPATLRAQLVEAFDPSPRVLRESTADAGLTRKVLLECGGPGGEAVESVLMLYPRSRRATVCISTQAGCALGCPFCATGQAGFRRQLGLGEILHQVTVMQRLLARGVGVTDAPDHVTNVVFMGMGEPLANLEPTIAAVRWLTGRPEEGEGFGLSARSVTVSTVGLVPGIRRLQGLGLPITLAVSLHAPNDALRDDLVPVNRQHPLADLLAACRDYVAATSRRLTFEYVLIEDINAGGDDARKLAELIRGGFPDGPVPHVNLIPMNATPAVPWRAPPTAAQRAFAAVLEGAGIPATLRRNRGTAIDAACGQLYADYALSSGRTLPAAEGAAQRLEAVAATRPAPLGRKP
ncbi:MAG: 23S rRNA (adenine(2503)-C(2))-methyltransferase RlmN [Nitriliruptorales bacterium]|nr:23S rRNA (adenine(2503)-C(2))-methyltransferase RlmN [Nitriliruptorales bacterium]